MKQIYSLNYHNTKKYVLSFDKKYMINFLLNVQCNVHYHETFNLCIYTISKLLKVYKFAFKFII